MCPCRVFLPKLGLLMSVMPSPDWAWMAFDETLIRNKTQNRDARGMKLYLRRAFIWFSFLAYRNQPEQRTTAVSLSYRVIIRKKSGESRRLPGKDHSSRSQ